MQKFTKIIATVSDLRCDIPFIQSIYNEGVNVVRMNSAHLDEEGFLRVVNNVRAVSPKIALLIDTKGPEIRTTKVEDGSLKFVSGDKVCVKPGTGEISTKDVIYVSYQNILRDVHAGDDILIDDGEVHLKVVEANSDCLQCEIQNNGNVGSRKSVNIPGVRISLPTVTEKDRKFIKLAHENNIDFIAHSFVRSREDVMEVQEILDELNSDIKIIAKIENQEGVDNIDEIMDAAYGIMIARGDLGIEVPQEKIPGIQRMIIRKAVQHKVPVIVATQMLHSMIEHPRPTRAEITDIANAIFYRTDAIMLSGETAYGKYPVEAVRTMSSVAREAEKTKLSENDIRVPYNLDEADMATFFAKQAVKSSVKLGTKAIFTDSHTGHTARVLAAMRGSSPVFAITTTERLARELALSYGVFADFQPGASISNTKESRRAYYTKALRNLIDKNIISPEDRIAYLGGSFGETGGTTYLDISKASDILEAKEHYNLPDYTL